MGCMRYLGVQHLLGDLPLCQHEACKQVARMNEYQRDIVQLIFWEEHGQTVDAVPWAKQGADAGAIWISALSHH